MALQIPSGVITGVSGGNITSGTTLPLLSYPQPVILMGNSVATASGNSTITHFSGALNVNISGGSLNVVTSISGNIVLVVSGGAIQVSGTVTVLGTNVSGGVSVSGNLSVGVTSGVISIQSGSVSISSGSIGANISGGVSVSGNLSVGVTSGVISIQSGSVSVSSGNITLTGVINSGTIGNVRSAVFDSTFATSVTVGSTTAASDAIIAANQFTLGVSAYPNIFNGTTWDRTRSVQGAGLGISGGTLGVLATGPMPWKYTNITGAAMTNIYQSGSVILHILNVNQVGGSGQQIKIADSQSGIGGTTVGTILGTESGFGGGSNPGPFHLSYDILLNSGLVISTSGTGWDLTVTWRNLTS